MLEVPSVFPLMCPANEWLPRRGIDCALAPAVGVRGLTLQIRIWLTGSTGEEYSTLGTLPGASGAGEWVQNRHPRQPTIGADGSPKVNRLSSALGTWIGGVSMDGSGSRRRRIAAVTTVTSSVP